MEALTYQQRAARAVEEQDFILHNDRSDWLVARLARWPRPAVEAALTIWIERTTQEESNCLTWPESPEISVLLDEAIYHYRAGRVTVAEMRCDRIVDEYESSGRNQREPEEWRCFALCLKALAACDDRSYELALLYATNAAHALGINTQALAQYLTDVTSALAQSGITP